MFRFTLREILLLTVVVAMAVGWWLEHRQYANHKEVQFILLNNISATENQLAASRRQLEVATQWIEAKKTMDKLGIPWPHKSEDRLFGQKTDLHN